MKMTTLDAMITMVTHTVVIACGEMRGRYGGDRGETQGRYMGDMWERALEDLMQQDGVVIRWHDSGVIIR